MSNRDLSLALTLRADSARFIAGLTQAEGGVRRFGGVAKREFDALKGHLGSIQGQLAALGMTTGAAAGIMQSARMDKSLTQIGQTAGVTRSEVEGLRKELFRMAGETGQSVDDLQQGFGGLIATGLSFGESAASIDAINKAMAISTVTSTQLGNALTVASAAFNFDISKPGKAVELLDKMTVAGGLGSAELDKLPDIFARVGVNAASAGMGFEKTLAFIEALSKIEKQPERLGTLAESTLRLFTNAHYLRDAAAATGVKFFEKGQNRDPVAVLRDIKREYDKLSDDKSRFIFMNNAFGKADLDTIKGLKTLLGGNNMLDKIGDFTEGIMKASGEVERRLPDAISNAVDQTGRLKAELRGAADAFSKPINNALQGVIKWGLDKKENGGLGLSGKEIVVGGTVMALGTMAAARWGGMGISALTKRLGGTAAGVAEGKALEAAAGVTPVFVVNWPASMGGSAADIAATAAGAAGGAGAATRVASRAKSLAVLARGLPLSVWGTMGAAGLGTAAAGVSAAGAGGYLFGSGLNWAGEKLAKGRRMEGFGTDVIGGSIAKILAAFGNESARRAVSLNEKASQTKIAVAIQVNGNNVESVRTSSDNPRIPLDIDAGYTMLGP